MFIYKNISVCEDEVICVEKAEEVKGYLIRLYLKNKNVLNFSYKTKKERDLVFTDIIRKIKIYKDNKEKIVAKELIRLRRTLDTEKSKEYKKKKPYLNDDSNINSLGLRTKICNCLLKNGLRTIGDIRNKGYEALAFRGSTGIRGFGKESLKELCEKIKEKTGEPLQ